MADWSCGVPRDPLASILHRLPLRDCIRFSAVCVAWRSLVAERGYPRQLPWLLLPKSEVDEVNETCTFYSLSDKLEYKIHLPGVPRKRRCLGSFDGWLVIRDYTYGMRLLNPLTRAQIQFPSAAWDDASDFMENVKAAVSWSSSSSYSIVVLWISTRALTFVRAGDVAWTSLERKGQTDDVVHQNGLFYVYAIWGRVEALDLTGPSPKFTPIAGAWIDRGGPGFTIVHLVKSSGDLFHLMRKIILEPGGFKTIGFKVFKLHQSASKWTEVKTLGNRVFFLSRDFPLSLNAHDFPGLKGSCIYFNMNFWYGSNDTNVRVDLWVFDLEDGSFNTYHPHDPHLTCPIPISFMPNLS